ncbi:uncharacterized protein [Halyomorpha halys]|uniref:uncharacterized protein n=1 Tax=Halyomorpha halys TaxID=286706 RepID=UPI0006D50ED3|nr:uncharacterized protein LOC106677625 [Halyomorpha halys]
MMISNETVFRQFSVTSKKFSWIEHTVFFTMIIASLAIGVYYGCKPKKKEQTVDDYMLGGRKMPIIPVAMSLVVSFVSGITLIGFPAEMYFYGTQLYAVNFSILIGFILLNVFYLPVFYNLKFNSLYEYLERRFHRSVRTLASGIFAFSLLLYIPVVIYVPALAFNQVTGMPLYFLATIICTICIIYTSLGGLKAVVWSDALQSIFTFVAMIAVIVLGCTSVGGIWKMIEINRKGERMELFNMDPDPYKMYTFWTVTFGLLPIQTNFCATHPGAIQRYISLPTFRDARIVTICMCIGIVLFKTFSTWMGLLIYARYHGCDPIISNHIKKQGQLLPYFVMDVAGEYPGLAGIFLSGVVSTGLSTMSSGLNTVAGTVFEDFVRPFFSRRLTHKQTNFMLKLIVVFLGAVSVLLIYVVEKFGTIMQIVNSLQGITGGVLLFIFSFGMFIPWGNTKGVTAGTIAGLLTTCSLTMGTYIYSQSGDIKLGKKVTSIENCPVNSSILLGLNSTWFGHPGEGTRVFFSDSVPAIYRVSFLYNSLIGIVVSFTVACIVSFATGCQDISELEPELVIPQLRSFLIKQKKSMELRQRYTTDPIAEEAESFIKKDIHKNPSASGVMLMESSEDKLVSSLKLFNWAEYCVFFGMLASSALIGVYYGCKPKKEVTVDEYMLGGRSMSVLPVAMSLIASFISGISLLGIPAETFYYGTQLVGITFAVVIGYFLLNYFYLPVVYHLQYNSLFEYLEKRFNRSVRLLASFIFTFSLLLYIPVVIYVPSLAFNQVTGMSVHLLSSIICAVCIFYTSIGGLKAVVWSDALQSLFTIASIITVLILGTISVGGLSKIIEVSDRRERLELFNMNPDPFQRNTFWTTCIGSIPNWLKVLATHPGTVQRYISVPTYRDVKWVALIMCIGIVIIKFVTTFSGLIMYTKYGDCDPMVTKQIQKSGQLLPFYVMDVAAEYPGLAGMFLSGVVCTALSTMSTSLNTVAGTLYQDFIKPLMPLDTKDSTANLIMKTIVIVFGIICTLLVLVVEQLGTIIQISISLQGVTNGVALFIFTFGMFVPWGNTKGVLAGGLTGIVTTSWLAAGAHYYSHEGHIVYGTKVTTIENCPGNITQSLGLNVTRFGYPGEGTMVFHSDEVPAFYKISYLYYGLLGFIVAMIVACIVSIITGVQDPSELDPKLVIPQLRGYLTKKKKQKPHVQLYSVVPTSEKQF